MICIRLCLFYTETVVLYYDADYTLIDDPLLVVWSLSYTTYIFGFSIESTGLLAPFVHHRYLWVFFRIYLSFGHFRTPSIYLAFLSHLTVVCPISYTIYEPRCEKTGLQGFRPGPTQTGLYDHTRWLEA